MYLLDDATSALDGKTEEFLERFRKRMKTSNAAAIIISNRKAVLSMADKVHEIL